MTSSESWPPAACTFCLHVSTACSTASSLTTGGVSMGKTLGDFYKASKKPANMWVALGVRARDFMELFLERMEKLSLAGDD